MGSFEEDFKYEIEDCTQEYECEQIESALDQIAALIGDFEYSGYIGRVEDRKITIREEEEEKRDKALVGRRVTSLQSDISDRHLHEMFSSLIYNRSVDN